MFLVVWPINEPGQTLCEAAAIRRHFHGTVAEAEQLFSHYEIAFVASYLSICEALKQNCRVIAHYSNDFIKDYLSMSIYRDYILLAKKCSSNSSGNNQACKDKKIR